MAAKRILITGKNSYVGTSLLKWLRQWPEQYAAETLSMIGDGWKSVDLSKYDVIFHVAGIVHKQEKQKTKALYFQVNRDLTQALATRAKAAGVQQFIFMSSLSVYGLEGEFGKGSIIRENTPCKPTTYYGKSKLEAERLLNELSAKTFKVSIIRAPMIYGRGCPGNYLRLRAVAKKMLIFPAITNQRSILYIDYLSEFVKRLMDQNSEGIFFPQNKNFVSTIEMMHLISKCNEKRLYFSKWLAIPILLFGKEVKIIKKIFGSLVVEQHLSNNWDYAYNFSDFEKTIVFSEAE